MANQRPIRRGRVPFRRGKRWLSKARPKRWNAAVSSASDGLALNTAVNITDEGLTDMGYAAIAILCDGQVDVEPWADEQEVLIDRIVGQIHFHGYYIQPASGAYALMNHVPLIKAGIVVNEEVSADGAPVTRRLFNQEDLEDTEWMWLWSGFPPDIQWQPSVDVQNGHGMFAMSLDIDLKNRRKVGQKDELALYAEFASPSTEYTVQVQCLYDLRVMMVSK